MKPLMSVYTCNHSNFSFSLPDKKQHSDGHRYSSTREDSESKSSKFDLPTTYDRSYRIPFSIVPPDLAYKLRMSHERRSEKVKKGDDLTMDHLTEFRTVLRHFVNFKQKQKVTI